MADESGSCPKCQGALTQLQGGLAYCPKCGFEGEESKPDPDAAKGLSKRWFWIALVSPALMALASFGVGSVSEKAHYLGGMIGFVALIMGLVSSIFCGWWLARRFFESQAGRVVACLVLMTAIFFFNLIIVVAGCSQNLTYPNHW